MSDVGDAHEGNKPSHTAGTDDQTREQLIRCALAFLASKVDVQVNMLAFDQLLIKKTQKEEFIELHPSLA